MILNPFSSKEKKKFSFGEGRQVLTHFLSRTSVSEMSVVLITAQKKLHLATRVMDITCQQGKDPPQSNDVFQKQKQKKRWASRTNCRRLICKSTCQTNQCLRVVVSDIGLKSEYREKLRPFDNGILTQL